MKRASSRPSPLMFSVCNLFNWTSGTGNGIQTNLCDLSALHVINSNVFTSWRCTAHQWVHQSITALARNRETKIIRHSWGAEDAGDNQEPKHYCQDWRGVWKQGKHHGVTQDLCYRALTLLWAPWDSLSAHAKHPGIPPLRFHWQVV